jgi:hypothetical protein
LIYAILVSFLPEYSLLTPFLLANTFVLLAIGQIFKTYKNTKAADILFNIGFLIAISSFFIPNYIGFLLIGFIGLFVLRSLKVFEIFQLISGALLAIFAYGSILYLSNSEVFSELTKFTLIPRFTLFESRGGSLYKIIIILAIAIFAVLNYANYTVKKNIQTQKKIDILFWFMIGSIIIYLLFKNINASQVLLLYIPLSIFLSFNFIRIKGILTQEIIHILLLGLLFALNFGLI